MAFVKCEQQKVADEETYRTYLENLQKSHQIDAAEYQNNMTMEQLQLAMQSSLNTSSIVHNFQLPLSPRQMSTLMLKTNHLSRALNFSELPSHISKNLINEAEYSINDLPQNHRTDDTSTIPNNLRGLGSDLACADDSVNRGYAHGINEDLNLRHIEHDVTQQVLRHSPLQYEIHSLKHEIEMSQRFEQNLASRIDQQMALDRKEHQRIEQRIDQILAQHFEQTLSQRLDQRVVNTVSDNQHIVDESDHSLLYIKPEQEDDAYVFYDNVPENLPTNALNEIIQQTASVQSASTNLPQEQLYPGFGNHIPIPALNSLELYPRTQNYFHNYVPGSSKENPQNLVVHKEYDNASPFDDEFKKNRQMIDNKNDLLKQEEPKENLRPNEQNRIFYYQNYVEKNENDSNVNNKLSDDLSLSIKGEYRCYKCKEVFPSKRVLKQHSKSCEIGVDSNELEKLGKFSCSQCAYRCQSPAILKIHERTHTGEKPYACTFCDYKSGQKNNVAKHILVHMKQKPYSCKFCEYSCAQKNNLVVHERTHTGYKPFACPFCEYRTVQKPNLVKHMYLHTDQKPFSCDMCSYRCVQKTNLTKHKQRHLNEKEGEKMDVKGQNKPYRPRQKSVKCPYCSYKCVQKSSLEKHLQYIHSDVDKMEDGAESPKKNEASNIIQNLSVKRDSQFECANRIVETLPVQP
ncbi:unnamed protein product [Leptidea sinapis]|uniref:C2H2-type domain-containing protein n=1 Tax=Leptidea sinapis TaxID=189913 RepID=A0A5E4PP42_9NEOP|nr:unnamed protein product [Leptidea sinapis]